MKNLNKIFISVAFLITLLIPQQVIAQTNTQTNNQTDQCNELKQQFANAGGTGVIKDLPVYCTTGAVYTKFLNFALYAVGIVAVIAIVYGGYLYMTSGGNEVQRKKGRSVLTWAIVGLVVVIAAAVIVNVVLKAIVENPFV